MYITRWKTSTSVPYKLAYKTRIPYARALQAQEGSLCSLCIMKTWQSSAFLCCCCRFLLLLLLPVWVWSQIKPQMSPYSAKIINTQVYTEFHTHSCKHTFHILKYLSGKKQENYKYWSIFLGLTFFWPGLGKRPERQRNLPPISTSSSKPLTPSCQPPQQFPSQLSWIITSMFWAPSFIPAFPPAGLLLLLLVTAVVVVMSCDKIVQ